MIENSIYNNNNNNYYYYYDLLSMEPWAAAIKKLSVSVAVPPAPVRVPRPLAPSVASVTSVANDTGDKEMILGLCTDLLAFALQPKKTPEILS